MGKDNGAPSAGQLRAMTESGRNLLVSAAAGSGKTFTLVERIIQNIEKGKYRVDELLIVTFTNAAATEMRERIEKKLMDKIESHPEIARQLVLLPNASISTMHAFCQRLIRENFAVADVDPKFRLVNEQERELMRQSVVRELFERMYEKQDEAFLRFARHYGSDRNDENLYAMVLKLYDFAESQAEPEDWLNHWGENARRLQYDSMEEAEWYPLLIRSIRRELRACHDAAAYFSEQADRDGISTYAEIFEDDEVLIDGLAQAVETEQWEVMQQAFCSIPKFRDLRKPPKMEIAKETASFYSEGRKNQIKAPLSELREAYFSENAKSMLEDIQSAGEESSVLCRLAIDFLHDFQAAKRKKAVLDFDDLEHYALDILRHELVCHALKRRYKEIMVDEYQDTNGVQEAILEKITNGANLFMVGDVKQSIYRFRLADPTLFINKQNDYRAHEENGVCVELSENYRSRGEVLAAVNFLFSQLMIYPETEISYDDRAALYPKADYPAVQEFPTFAGAPVELLLVGGHEEMDEDEADDVRGFEAEAVLIAQKLRELKDSGISIYDKEERVYRPLRWRDTAILLRAAKGKAQTLCEKLREAEIPAYAEADAGYFEEKEVSLTLALLAVIDNAHQDIPLAAVLHSIIGDMSAEELAVIRANAEAGMDFYAALSREAAIDKGSKAARFLEKLGRWRKLSRRVGVPELLWRLYRETNYYDYVGTQPGGLVRQANLRMLVDRAADYEKTNFRGLFRFLKFIRQMKERSTDLSVARTLGEKEDVVRIMTVHKSKGLEFPVVILADLSKKFNLQDAQARLLIHKELGIEMFCTKAEGTLAWQYPTAAWRIMKETICNEAVAEELRVLYVALTRAREKLILVGRVKNDMTKEAKKWCRYTARRNIALPGYAVLGAKCWLDWIGMAVSRSEEGRILRDIAGISGDGFMDYPASFGEPNLDIQIVSAMSPSKKVKEEEFDEGEDCIKRRRPVPRGNEELLLSRRSWKYAHCTNIPAKMTVTEVKRRTEDIGDATAFLTPMFPKKSESPDEVVQRDFPPPAFLRPDEIKKGGVVFGTLMHDVMQNLRLDGPLETKDIEMQLDCLLAEGKMTLEEREAVHVPSIAAFFSSPIGLRLRNAKHCWREQPFSLLLPAPELNPLASEEDEIFLQGTIDVFFEESDGRLILLDYKTDRNTTPQIIRQRYRTQMDLYARAVKAITGKAVDEIYIYRLSDGDTISFASDAFS